MSVNADLSQASTADVTLEGYVAQSAAGRLRNRGVAYVVATLVFCVFYGMAFAFLAPALLLAFAVPLVGLGALVIWALPDARRAPIGLMQTMFFAYTIAVVMWPNYLGIALPGLPWFTLARLTAVPVAILLLLCVSMSKPLRDRLGASMSAVPLIWKLMVGFVVMEVFSIPLSADKGLSINHLVNAQTYWTVPFFVSAYIFTKPGMLERFLKTLWAMGVVVGFIGIWEKHLRHVPWEGHIPQFLQIQDPVVARYLMGQGRAGTDIYRVQGTFLHPLALGEYIALVMPFVLQFAISNGKPALRIAAAVSVVFLVYIALISGSRSSLIGCVAAVGLFLLLWGARRWRNLKNDIIGPAIVLSYPIVFVGFMGATFFVGRLRNKIWGGGETNSSNEGRIEQWRKGIPLVAHNPIGHGMGMAAATLDYYEPNGLLTIDSYYLSIALEYGIAGLFLFYGMFIYAVYRAWSVSFSKAAIFVTDRELLMLAPVGMMIVNFIILKSIYSEEYNHCFVFMALGMICALIWRIKEQYRSMAEVGEAPVAAASPGVGRGPAAGRGPRGRTFGAPARTPAR